MPDYYDRRGRPLTDVLEWARLFEDPGYKVVAHDWARGWLVSTVWLGIDHSFGDGPPAIFETMIFPPRDEAHPDWDEDYQERYATEDAARAGHDRALAWLAEKLG